MIDMSHANSSKDHKKQLLVCDDICGQMRDGEKRIFGVMIESNLEEGRQDLGGTLEDLRYGQSVTDACIDWADTEACLEKLAEASATRMKA